MELQFLGACRDIGRSGILVNREILFDYGIKVGEVTEYPAGSVFPKAVFVSHGHLDHAGAIPGLARYLPAPSFFMTPPTASLSEMLARDTLKIAAAEGEYCPFSEDDLPQLFRRTVEINPGQSFDLSEYDPELSYKARFFDAGHIPGAVSIFLKEKSTDPANKPFGKSVYYTGDVNHQETRLVGKATEAAHADALIIESTYFGRDHPPREETEKRFIEDIYETINRGGTVLIPAFAIGRTQEILMLLHAHGISPFVEGMGVEAYERLIRFPDYLKHQSKTELVSAFKNAVNLQKKDRSAGKRHAPLGSVILTTSGMLEGGPALYYLEKLKNDPRSRLMLTGFQADGTNGRQILNSKFFEKDGKIHHVSMQVNRYDFSAHSGDKDLKKFVKSFCKNGTEKVFCVHGEDTEGFAEWVSDSIGVDAYAPEIGDRFVI
ncbi:MBL fold metallo-hydrolase [Methanolapillus millepedarum]|uniref:Ribonuclease n=1 Tax=Methanolapillus millepedarum TaxID=3028296 RepID=A0AA96VAX1_9EURY|nr:Ribonuclease [Methanosarcinaceae archaeon Ac7]